MTRFLDWAMRRLIYVSGVIGLLVFGNVVALAQGGPPPPTVQAGEYKNLTPLRWLKIGTAPLVNPELTTRSRIAYKYQLYQWNEGTMATLQGLADQGKLAIGHKVGDDIVVEPNQPKISEVISGPLSQDHVYVTTVPAPGLGAGDKIITWSAQGAINFRGLCSHSGKWSR